MAKELTYPSSQQSEDDNQRSKTRVRSSAYPSYTIEFCIEFTKRFHQQFGNTTFSQREEIAKVMKVSVGHIQTQISSSVQYGLIDMKVKVGYKPSDRFLRVYKPIDERERQEALFDTLLNPELYFKLITQFKDGIVPSVPGLATILFRNYNIAEAASESAAKIFIENLQFLNLLDNENHLLLNRDFGNETEEDKGGFDQEISGGNGNGQKQVIYYPEQRPVEQKNVEVALVDPPQTYPIPIPLKGGRVAKLVVPEGFTNEDLDKITRFIDALRE